jgi:hypothetical protein
MVVAVSAGQAAIAAACAELAFVVASDAAALPIAVSAAAWAVLTGLFVSAVLSTLPSPTCAFVTEWGLLVFAKCAVTAASVDFDRVGSLIPQQIKLKTQARLGSWKGLAAEVAVSFMDTVLVIRSEMRPISQAHDAAFCKQKAARIRGGFGLLVAG